MAKRHDLSEATFAKLRAELGPVAEAGTEFTENLYFQGAVGDHTFSGSILKYPSGEHPEAYQGQEGWVVLLRDEGGNVVEKDHNPEPMLKDALGASNWERVRDAPR